MPQWEIIYLLLLSINSFGTERTPMLSNQFQSHVNVSWLSFAQEKKKKTKTQVFSFLMSILNVEVNFRK